MTEIKFRAYDKKNKRMIDGWDLEYLNEVFESKKDGIFVIDDDLEILQFTGLKDKNGKEIFEGDIIQIRKLEGYLIHHGKVERNITGAFDIIIKDYGHRQLYQATLNDEPEIIGNIYENPELLEKHVHRSDAEVTECAFRDESAELQ